MPTDKAVVGYCRVSTLEQQKNGYGIAMQQREIARYAQERGWHVAALYADEAQSGMEERRHALRRLLRACKRGRIATVIVASLDRLSRSLRFAEDLFYQFEQLGVQICLVDMPHYDGTDRKEVLVRQIKGAIAEENRKEIIERLHKGRQERARQGKMSGGNVPYGYTRQHGTIQIVAAEARIIRQVFALHAEGKTDQAIAARLNVQGMCRRNGKPWTQREVWTIRHRRALYGEGVVRYGTITSKNKDFILLEEC